MDIGKLTGLPQGSDWILFNSLYHKNIDKSDRSSPDAITLIFKNMISGKKIVKTIKEPQMEIYLAKPHIDLGTYNHVDIPIDDVDVYDVNYKYKLKDMAKLIGKEQWYWNCIKERRLQDLDQLMLYNRFFSCDRNIEDFYMYKCRKHFGTKELTNTRKAYFDIEADIMKGYLDLKNTKGDAPVNMVSLLDEEKMIMYTLVLRDSDNPLIDEFEKDIPDILEEANEEFEDEFGHVDYKIAMFDSELELIRTLFQLLNTINPDFAVCWNMGFDIPYIMHRLKALGVNPADIMCHPDFDVKECFYVKDTRNFEIKKKTDWCRISSMIIYMDQMINYAAIRKSQAKIDSYKLDFIAEREVNSHKLDYSDIGHLKYLPYKDFKRFYLYNLKDVLVQYKIEKKVHDLDDVFYRSYTSNTRYAKVFKEITFLTNVAFHDFEEFGLILGNNVNAIKYNGNEEVNLIRDDDDDDEEDEGIKKKKKNDKEKFDGAINLLSVA